MTGANHPQASVLAEKIRDNSILDLQLSYRSGELKVSDVTRLFLNRIENLNPSLHAIISVNTDSLRVAAQQDARIKNGDSMGPLFGIAILVKDNIETIY